MTAKRLILFCLVIFLIEDITSAQNIDSQRLNYEHKNYHFLDIGLERLNQQNTAMWLLLGWGGLNVIGGSTLALNDTYGDFGIMSAGWGAVNAAIATFALMGTQTYTDATMFSEILKDEQLFNRILAVNSGLNVGYISAGISMNYFGKTNRIKQFGTAVAIQGAFLMAFDAWLLLSSNARLNDLAVYPDMLSLNNSLSNILVPSLALSFNF